MTVPRIPRAVYVFQNGQTMVFDQDGDQIADLQGRDGPARRQQIRDRADPQTVWHEHVQWPGVDCPDAREASVIPPEGKSDV